MNINRKQTLVLKFDEKLISKLNGEDIIITTDNFNLLNRTFDVVNEENKLNNITVYYDGALTSIKFLENWKKIPLTIYVTGLGSHRMFFHMLGALRQMNLRIFLPSNVKQSFLDAQILSSLGVLSGIYFNSPKMDWDKVKDLQMYDIYAKTSHAPIEPFHYVAANYKGDERLDFNAVYYNDPTKYLHVNSDGKVALTMDDLKNQNYALDDLKQINTLKDNEQYIKLTTAWQQHFLDKSVCSFCPAWRICLGKFSETIDENKECQTTMMELLEGAEIHQKQHKKKPAK